MTPEERARLEYAYDRLRPLYESGDIRPAEMDELYRIDEAMRPTWTAEAAEAEPEQASMTPTAYDPAADLSAPQRSLGSRVGNEDLAAGRALALDPAASMYSLLDPEGRYADTPIGYFNQALMRAPDLALGGLLAMFGGAQKAAGYGSDLLGLGLQPGDIPNAEEASQVADALYALPTARMAGAISGAASRSAADTGRQFAADESGALRLWHGTPHDFPPAVRVLDNNTGKTYVQPANDPVTTGLLNLEPNRYSVLEENPLGMFDFSKMGTGEGAQAYGWGGYLAEAEPVAVEYRNRLSGNPYGDILEVVMGGTPVKDPTDVQLAMAKSTNKGQYVDTLKSRLAEAEAKVSASPKLTPGDDISTDDLQTLINMSKRDSLKEELAEAESLLDVDIRTKPPGHVYETKLKARPEQFLDWDIPLGQQSPYVKDALSRLGVKPFDLPSFNREAALRVSNLAEVDGLADWAKRDLMKAAMEIDASPDINYTLNRLKQMQMEFGISPDSGPWKETADGFLDFVRSSDVYKNADMPAAIVQRLADEARATGAIGEDIADAYPAIMTSQKAASQKLLQAGIPGSRHFDAGSRGAGSGTRNYVVFDENLIEIVRRYGIAGAASLLGISAADVEQAMAQGQPQGLLAGGPQ